MTPTRNTEMVATGEPGHIDMGDEGATEVGTDFDLTLTAREYSAETATAAQLHVVLGDLIHVADLPGQGIHDISAVGIELTAEGLYALATEAKRLADTWHTARQAAGHSQPPEWVAVIEVAAPEGAARQRIVLAAEPQQDMAVQAALTWVNEHEPNAAVFIAVEPVVHVHDEGPEA